MDPAHSKTSTQRRLAITVRGVVQGVGFRPFVYNTAKAKGLSGWVQNEADMVRLEVEGTWADIDRFLQALRTGHPPQARIDELTVSELPGENHPAATFEIRASKGQSAPQPTIPADLATCDKCLAEIRDPLERRYRYPFTNCTNCGPRWSIIEHLPYDRPRTSMAQFAMCHECRAEYENPADRRFHAQPIACPKCGPHIELHDSAGNYITRGEEAITLAAAMILENRVLALKGLGGFQLIVDATSPEAVARLRERKHRPDRPFALMIATLDQARRYCEISEEEAKTLASHRAPIVLLRKREDKNSPHPSPLPKGEGTVMRIPKGEGTGIGVPKGEGTYGIVEGIAPGNPYLGMMLPYTPLHHLLMEAVGRPIVCTSGNLTEDPMAIENREALDRLGSIADVFLMHDRAIVRPVDDSIVRVGPGGIQVLRRARGFAPLPLHLQIAAPTILALGGHLKNTVALCLGGRVHETRPDETARAPRAACQPAPLEHHQSTSTPADERPVAPAMRENYTPVVMSAHIGDLDSLQSVEVFRRAVDDLIEFFAVTPDGVACDLHPDYASTRQAEMLCDKWRVPLVRVQHHHAHAAAAMAEHALQGAVLALTWDGTGYGTDGTIWGGEVLRCEGAGFSRLAHLRTFALPGGDQAVHEPRRSALGALYEILGDDAVQYACDWFTAAELAALKQMLNRAINCPRTSSMGRLFDAVAVLSGLPRIITFEGQAAMALEFAADKNEHSAYDIPVQGEENQMLIANWGPMLHAILADRAAGTPVSIISARFHNALAELALNAASRVELEQVVLSGGCFQNALLTELVYNRLRAAGFSVYLHKEIPPGDGGIALGQIYVAALKGFRVQGPG